MSLEGNLPAAPRFSEAEFIEELAGQGLELMKATEHVLFGDIFIGVARTGEKNVAEEKCNAD